MGAIGHGRSVGSGTMAGRRLVGLERVVGVVAAATVVRCPAFVRLVPVVRIAGGARGGGASARVIEVLVGFPRWHCAGAAGSLGRYVVERPTCAARPRRLRALGLG